MPLTTIELLSQASSVGRARISDVIAAGVLVSELLRLHRLGLVDLLPAARPIDDATLPTVPDYMGGRVQLEYVNLI